MTPASRLAGALFVVLVWGAAFPAVKIGLLDFSVTNLAIVRFLIAQLVFLILFWTGLIPYRPIAKAHRLRVLLAAALIVPGYQLVFHELCRHLPATVLAIMIQISPAFTYVLAVLMKMESAGRRTAAGLVFALFGAAVILARGGNETWSSAWLALSFAPPLCLAIYTVLTKPLVQEYGASNLAGQTMIAGTVLLLLSLPFHGGIWQEARSASTMGWIAVSGLALFGSVGVFILWSALLATLKASQTAALVNLVPLVTAGLSVVLLHESVGAREVLGGLLVVVGMAFITTRATPHRSGVDAGGGGV